MEATNEQTKDFNGKLQIKENVAKKIKESNSEVIEGVINSLVEEEVTKRKDLIKKCIDKIDEIEKEVKKMKPDAVTISLDGTKTENWSAIGFENLEKKKKEVEKFESALNNALQDGNYEKLNSLLK